MTWEGNNYGGIKRPPVEVEPDPRIEIGYGDFGYAVFRCKVCKARGPGVVVHAPDCKDPRKEKTNGEESSKQ